MRLIKGTTDFYIDRPTAVCIGKFDGVHSGHRMLLEHITAKKALGLIPTVFTFDMAPEELFTGVHNDELCTRDKKLDILEQLGVELVIEYPLTMDTASIEPEDFIAQILVDRLNMRYIAAGPDLSYGKGGKGGRELIEYFSHIYGYDVDIIDKLQYEGSDVSSSRIRQALSNGEKTLAENMLGRHGLA